KLDLFRQPDPNPPTCEAGTGGTMQITLTWGDVVVHTLIALGVAFVVYLFSLLYRYIAPRVTDYLAQRSVSAAQAKIARLEQRLAQYEADFADSRLFIARTIYNGVSLLFSILFFIGSLLMSAIFHLVAKIRCEFYHNCPDAWNIPFWEATYDDKVSLIFLDQSSIETLVWPRLPIRPRSYSPQTFGAEGV